VIDPLGRPIESLLVGEQGTIEVELGGRKDRTLYNRSPWLVPAASCVLALALLIAPLAGARSGSASRTTHHRRTRS
jgi:apolipoprotein N-acyltransferase